MFWERLRECGFGVRVGREKGVGGKGGMDMTSFGEFGVRGVGGCER